MIDPRLAKHISYWLTLNEVDKQTFRKVWPWIADVYDAVVHKYVTPANHSEFRAIARVSQVTDHVRANRGQTLEHAPSLSLPDKKGAPGSKLAALQAINRVLAG
jgi:hypothetical protein